VLAERFAFDAVGVGLGLTCLGQAHVELQQLAVLIVAGGRTWPPAWEMTGWLMAMFG